MVQGVWDDLKQYDKAIPDCDEAIKLNPRCVFAYDNRGIAWMHKGQLDKALADFDQSIKLDPQSGAPYCNRGVVWTYKREYAEAIADLTHATTLDPQDARVLNMLAWFQATCPDERYRDGKKALANALHAVELSGANALRVPTRLLPPTQSAATLRQGFANGETTAIAT